MIIPLFFYFFYQLMTSDLVNIESAKRALDYLKNKQKFIVTEITLLEILLEKLEST